MMALWHQLRTGDVILAGVLFLAATWLACFALAWLLREPWQQRLQRYRRFAWQIGVLLGLEQAYEFTRGQIPHQTDVALLNAYTLLDLEWRHGFFVESRIERFFLQFGALMNAIDLFYVLGHVLVTIGALIWLYTRRPHIYPFVRNLLMMATAIALVAFYLYPTAPPRMLGNYGFVDPLQLHHFVGAGGADPGSFTYNPYAAMPSLHVAYALIAGWGLFLGARHTATRVLCALYPFAMAATVIISGNHWLLDVAGAVVTVLISALLVTVLARLHEAVRSQFALSALGGAVAARNKGMR